MDLVRYETPHEAAAGAADRVASLISDHDGPFSLGLAGGSTPEAMYRELQKRDAPWGDVTAWLSDERWVPPYDDRSNGRMAESTLTGPLGILLLRPEFSTEMSPEASAAMYEEALSEDLQGRRPELILLGLGADGHTASLFPGSKALDEKDLLYAANEIPESGESRLTATYPLLWDAQRLLVLVIGESKAEALQASLQRATPAGLIGEGNAEVEWHVDAAASSLLS